MWNCVRIHLTAPKGQDEINVSISITLPQEADCSYDYSLKMTLNFTLGVSSLGNQKSTLLLGFTFVPDEATQIDISFEGVSLKSAISFALEMQERFKDRSRDTGVTPPDISGTIEIVKSS